jgi:hypothetical protein
MTFRHHPQDIAREAANAEALRAAGLDPVIPGFYGKLVGPKDKDYDKDRKLSDPAFNYYPKLIAYCGTEVDVAACLRYARAQNLQFVCRSGGHNTAGYSMIQGGLCIDLSNFTFMIPIPPSPSRHIFVGPGTQFQHLNKFLSLYDMHIPGGGCGNVCVGGYMQGGGYGFTSREFGMNCDNVTEMRVMLWDRRFNDVRTVIANRSTNPDLFWAVRGGTGNNFGVVTAVTYKLHQLPGLWGAWLQWPLDQGVEPLYLLQNQYMLSGAPNKFGYMVLITAQGPQNVPVVMVRAAFTGSESELDALLAPLLNTPGAGPPPGYPLKKYGKYDVINHDLLEEPYPIPQNPENKTWGEDKQSGYIEKTLQRSDWQAILDYFKTAPCPYNLICLEPYGGKINNPDPGVSNAFIHRTPAMDFFVDSFWDMAGNGEQQAKHWLDGFMERVGGKEKLHLFNGHCYQNYPRAELVALPGYKDAYWGLKLAYPGLVKVKNKYDPTDFFNFPQSIHLTVDEGMQAVATPIDQYIDQPITYDTMGASERAA